MGGVTMLTRLILATGAATLLLGACTTYGEPYAGDFGGYGYEGRDFVDDDDRNYFLGEGAFELDPWLANTEEGRRIVRTGFRDGFDGRLSVETADRVNLWFRRYADSDGDLRLTDPEIRVALVQAARGGDYRW
jgi:hypothetical protein